MRSKFNLDLLPSAPTLELEQEIWGKDDFLIAGLDEAGRGALAGPLYAAAVILPHDHLQKLLTDLSGVRDSKQMSAKAREATASTIKKVAVSWGIGICSAEEIDRLGMGQAGRIVFERAASCLLTQPDFLLTDYFTLPAIKKPQMALVKGDARSLTIACASVLAKTTRDAFMRDLDGEFPWYGFASNKGYGTQKHRQAILTNGACPEHRKSFRLLSEQERLV